MRPFGWVLLVAAIVAAACSGGGEAETVDRLVVVGDGGGVVTVAPDGSDPVTLDVGDDAAAFQPVWSPDATRIAWGSIGVRLGLAVADVASGEVTFTETSANPFYLAWSPTGDRLALLRNDVDGGIAFETAAIDADGVVVTTLDRGQPYYFAWRPDGGRLVTHVGTDRFDVIDLDGSLGETGLDPGPFLAPEWIDRGIVTALGSTGGGELVIATETGDTEPIARFTGWGSFVADPSGDRVAFYSFPVDGGAVSVAMVEEDLSVGVLTVIDIEDGTQVEVTEGPILAFQWSPDSERLLVLGTSGVEGDLRWWIWADRVLGGGPAFTPVRTWVRDYLPFHDQYARSMTLWSPVGTAFAFPGTIDGRTGIWRHDLASNTTEFVIEGSWVVWSPV
ncbi:MAG: hypothetical protein ACR2JP_11405 [Acidimicrobiia bacterium]